MQFITESISSNELERLKKDIVFINKGFSSKIFLESADINGNLGEFNLEIDKLMKFTEIKYWMELIEYDLTCIHSCLICLFSSKYEKVNLSENVSILEIADFSFFFDNCMSKLFSLTERMAQLINCAFSLGLVENKMGPTGVSLSNVKKRAEKSKLFELVKLISNVMDMEMSDHKKIRNGITHHYHPLNKSNFLESNLVGETITINKVTIFNFNKDEDLKSIKELFSLIEGLLQDLFQQISAHFEIRGVRIENQIVVEVTSLRIKFA